MLERKLSIKTSAGNLSATINEPESATHTLLLAHGAGADHQHSHMAALAAAFANEGFFTLRFNFPFKQAGRNRVDSKEISVTCIEDAARALQNECNAPLLAGGHSFGGRMATHAVAEGKVQCDAMILCSYPLHPAGKPGIERAKHLGDITAPMLFLSGTRDKLAEPDLLNQEIGKLDSKHHIHWLETGDHSYKILKRTRTASEDIYLEAAIAARRFINQLP